jgi:predicted nuclease with TOPRIM domain
VVKALEAENDELKEQKDTKQGSYDQLKRSYDVLESEQKASKNSYTISIGQYKLLENANRSLALDGKTKLAEQKFASGKELKK